ncbi:MAG: undecaprenyl-diphosphate phosphatase [Bacteroidia bacterium]
MDILNAILLGIIQGLTEFLPVSSSGHLELAKVILGQDYEAKSSLLMTVVLHAATALATIVVFRKEVAEIFRGLFQFKWNEQTAFSLKIVLSMIPAAIVGLVFEKQIEQLFSGNLLLVGICLIVTGLLLFLADRAKTTEKAVGFGDAFIVGIAQAIAILPGISRSGATISTSVLLGIDRSRAARFSFLMVVPLILGKMAKDILDGAFQAENIPVLPLSIGFIAAFITGIAACTWMISLVRKAQLSWFAIYCIIVGAVAIGYTVFA